MTHVNPFIRTGRVLTYHGDPVYLAGKYPTTAAGAGIDALPNIDYEPVMQAHAAQRNNFFRHWIFPYWHYGKPGNAYSPFRRGADGRWDLRPPYNDDYFRRLDRMIRAALHHGVVVQLTIFDATGLKAIDPARWAKSPWNDANNVQSFIAGADGTAAFFDHDGIPGLAQAQKGLVDEVVGRTMGYWNVCYEIMNECGGGALAERVRWIDTVTGWIDAKTGGGRLVFHNDYAQIGTQSGSDVDHWCRNQATLRNFPRLDGVIFHNNPRTVKPDTDPRYACFRAEKVFQVSTDAFDETKREDFAWNLETTRQVFALKMMFQAEAVKADVARGIGQAAPSPTPLRLAPFTHTWRKTSAAGPQFDLRFFVDAGQGFFIAYRNAEPYGELTRGRVEDFRFEGETQAVRLYDRLVDATHWWRYTFSGETLTLVNETNGFTQTFQRIRRVPVDAPLTPFLYNWERVEATGGPARHYSMRFDVDGALRTYRLDPYRPIDHHDVRAIDTAAGTITLYRFLSATTGVWRYAFETVNGTQRLRLTSVQNPAVVQVYERRPWFVPDTVIAAPATAVSEAELVSV
jgi:hypothetical protein